VEDQFNENSVGQKMSVCSADYRRDCEEGRSWTKKREELVKECENMKKHYENTIRERDQVRWHNLFPLLTLGLL
jgi:hypothetical protein